MSFLELQKSVWRQSLLFGFGVEEVKFRYTMAQFEESIRNQITALMRVMSLSKCMNEDKVPSKIEDISG